VPEVSRFYGIVITVNYGDHLPPHFHARYSGDRAALTFDGQVIAGSLPPRALGLVVTWAARHTEDLRYDWELARAGRPLVPIEPLD
jgi:Domain of unknown function (DUF4160)